MNPDQSSDARFVVFIHAKYGIRAIARVLIAYTKTKAANGSPIDTIGEIFARYAPAIENNTNAYVSQVAASLRTGADAQIKITDPNVMRELIKAIVQHENGMQPYDGATIDAGMLLAGISMQESERPSRTIQASTVAGASTVALGGTNQIIDSLNQAQSTVQMLTPYMDAARYILIGIVLASLAVVIYERVKKRNLGVS
jgi:hypothetical protein